MLRSLKELERYKVSATDGDVGCVANFFFDDQRWTIRYLVVETSGLFDGRKTLISPIFFREVDWSHHCFHLALTKAKVDNCPSVNADKPVSRQHESVYFRYHGTVPYWGYSGLWGMGNYPGLLATEMDHEKAIVHSSQSGDIHLRSAREVRGYHIQGRDGEIGHVEDLIVDDKTWQIRYLEVNTSNWWFGRKVLVAPNWANGVSWESKKVYLDLSRAAIKASPKWNVSAAINREYEAQLHSHYGHPLGGDGIARPPDTLAAHSSVSRPD